MFEEEVNIMHEVWIVGAKRTAIGDFLGKLKDVCAVDLGVTVVNAALAQAGVSAAEVQEVACGQIYKAGAKGNPGRQIQLNCGMPVEEQDELALLSHQRAIKAIQSGVFKDEIVPVTIETRKGPIVIDTDEHPRADVTIETLAAMKPAFKKDGTVTAGNASGVNDGAAALVLVSAEKGKAMGLKPLAKLRSTANFGVAPEVMGIGPAFAIPKAIELAGLTAEDIGYYEINEAFAAQFLAVNRE